MNDSKIKLEELETLLNAKKNAMIASFNAKLSQIEAKNAELEYENILLKIYLNYELTSKDSINEVTGEIKIDTKEENDDKDESTEGKVN